MTAVVYGSIRTLDLGTTIAGPVLPVLPPLPTEDSPIPRRRRSTICPNLTIDGERPSCSSVPIGKTQELLKISHGVSRATIRCDMRRGVELEKEFCSDLCLTSWSRTCCWLEDVAA